MPASSGRGAARAQRDPTGPPIPGRPGRRELAETPAHVVARDYPETVAVFRRQDVDLPTLGGEPVERGAGDVAEALLDALEAVIAWREERSPST